MIRSKIKPMALKTSVVGCSNHKKSTFVAVRQRGLLTVFILMWVFFRAKMKN
jgi:hypothetical protein